MAFAVLLTIACAVVPITLTFVVLAADANGAAWAVIQFVLVLIAVTDIRTRWIPNMASSSPATGNGKAKGK